MERTLVYFVADVHLGTGADAAEREARFVSFLKGIPRNALAVWLLGDIWDFWYEYRDVVPRDAARVVSELIALMDAGVEVYFVPGNHDIWTYSYFTELGIHRVEQPYSTVIGGRSFCLGHGDSLGGSGFWYGLTLRMFRSKVLQALFSTLHPWIAYRLARAWSGGSRKRHSKYKFKGDGSEPLYRFAAGRTEDFCIFGHFHDGFSTTFPDGRRFIILQDWMGGGEPHAVFDTATSCLSLIPSEPRSEDARS
ncbi:MAG: UDP-2,3-diacylglucosamine diphosphatase [Bacteroidales bacterium]|nr:UDP-2,3-diacylglucosamine diphosphatase [Bacteroidales bacterium]